MSNAAANLDADIYPVNNFFCTLGKRNIKYGKNKSLVPTSTPQEIYQYSDSMLKHFPKNALKMIQSDLWYSKNLVIIAGGNDIRIHNNVNEVYKTDFNLKDCQDKLGAQIDAKYLYREPLKYFCDLGKINFPTKIDLKIRCTLQTETKKLFKLKKNNNNWSVRCSNCICKGFLY